MPFEIQGGGLDIGNLLAGLRPGPSAAEYAAEAVKQRTAQQEAAQKAALFPLQKQEAELQLKAAQYNEQERQIGLQERQDWQNTMSKYAAEQGPRTQELIQGGMSPAEASNQAAQEIYAKARPELAPKMRPTTLGAIDKLYTENFKTFGEIADKRAETAKRIADTKKVQQELNEQEREEFGRVGQGVVDANYSEATFEALLHRMEQLHEKEPALLTHIQNIRDEAGRSFDAFHGVVDSMVTPKARAAAQELADKLTQQRKAEAETRGIEAE